MELDSPFVRLPLQVDAAALAAEIADLPSAAWTVAERVTGTASLVLVGGEPTRSPLLDALPYTCQLLAVLGAPVGRCRLLRLGAGTSTAPIPSLGRFDQEHLALQVAVRTAPDVVTSVRGCEHHLAPGQVWAVDTWWPHGRRNRSDGDAVHLVVDTVGSVPLWELVKQGERPAEGRAALVADQPVARLASAVRHFDVELQAPPALLTPWELARHIELLARDVAAGPDAATAEAAAGTAALRALQRAWRQLWAIHGAAPTGRRAYLARRERVVEQLRPLEGRVRLATGADLVAAAFGLVVGPAVASSWPLGPSATAPGPAAPVAPVFVVAPPHSHADVLVETLALAADTRRADVARWVPAGAAVSSDRLVANDATPARVNALTAALGGPSRFVDGAPVHALRVPFLGAAFPDVRFVYVWRDPREAVSEMLDAWRAGTAVSHPTLPGWPGPPWSLPLVPGWEVLCDRPLAEVVTTQWATITTTLLDDLEALDADRWCVTSHEALVRRPAEEAERLCAFFDLRWEHDRDRALPFARFTVDAPDAERWRHNAVELETAWSVVEPVAQRAHALFAEPPAVRAVRPPTTTDTVKAAPADQGPVPSSVTSFASVHTASFVAVLDEIGATPIVSTYQSGRLIALRVHDGTLNTHFRSFTTPMGLAIGSNGVAVGTKRAVWLYDDNAALAARIEPAGTHDACLLPRTCRVTGDIAVHEVGWVDDELWMVNTRFSCLAVLDDRHSFRPVWRPPWITALAAEDRCHLNGMALVPGAVRYVTCLGTADTRQGWRERKADGGVVLEVPSGEVVAGGLSMPHSPRLHAGRLWVLESGRGAVCTVDLVTGEVTTVAELPGFTRGLAFAGDYAFVGLSQVRDSVFGGIPLAERLDARLCGVWVLDIRSGETVAFVRFDGDVGEVFDIQLLPGVRYPEIVEPGADLTGSSFLLPADVMSEVADPG